MQFNVPVWIDEAEIKVGDSLLAKIASGLVHSDYLGIVLSPESVNSPWCQKEVQIATTLEIENKKLKVLPILHKTCDIPIFLREKAYSDFRNPRQFSNRIEELLRVLLPFDIRQVLCDVVRNAALAEFSTYKALPLVKVEFLDAYFAIGGSARARIVHLLNRHHDRAWTISNPQNPSTCEVLDASVKWIKGTRAEVSSREYWYLRWFDLRAEKYEYVLNEEIKPKSILIRDADGVWRINVQQYSTTTCYVG